MFLIGLLIIIFSETTLKFVQNTFAFNIKSSIPHVIDEIYQNYQFHEVLSSDSFIDFYISLDKPYSLRRWFKPQVNYFFEDHPPFIPLPLNQAYPMLEWDHC